MAVLSGSIRSAWNACISWSRDRHSLFVPRERLGPDRRDARFGAVWLPVDPAGTWGLFRVVPFEVMGRALPLVAAFVASLSLVTGAEGKVMLRSAEVCGQSGCATQTPRGGSDLPFAIFGPVIEVGRQVAPPASPAGARFEILLTTRPAPGGETVSVDYFPDAGYIRIHGQAGDEVGGALSNVGWVRLASAERDAYDALVSGATPFGAEAPADRADDGPSAIVIGVVIATALASITLIILFHRRTARSPLRLGGSS
jgi:hypothetical protein